MSSPEPGRRAWSRPLRSVAKAVVALSVVLVQGSGPAGAATSGPAAESFEGPGSAATVGECLGADQVWLIVVTEQDEVLRSECVGTPQTGTAALSAAEVALSTAKGGYLCTLAGHPEQCPRSYDGQYWQYWHAEGVGQRWVYSEKGASGHRPRPGSIEGWCRNREGQRTCRPPDLGAPDRAQPRVDAGSAAGTPWTVLVGLAVVVVAGAAVIRRRNRRARP